MATFIDTDGKRRTVGASAPSPQGGARGSASMATGQASVSTSASLVVAARAGRVKVTITPTSATVFYVGNAGVTATNGLYVPAGAAVTMDTQAAIYAVGAAALTVSYVEYY